MRMIDTHAHLTDERFFSDIDQVLLRAQDAGLSHIIVASASLSESRASIDLCKAKTKPQLILACTVGVHPHEAASFDDAAYSTLQNFLEGREKNRVVALGEIGLDYYYDYAPRERQREVFLRQMELAYTYQIPVVIHERDASKDMIDLLETTRSAGRLLPSPGICHCFSGSVETAQRLTDMGFFLGFDGPLTFKNAKRPLEVVAKVAADKLLIETDAPYLTPHPFRGRRNEPAYLVNILEKMAEIRGIKIEQMAQITSENAMQAFGLRDIT